MDPAVEARIKHAPHEPGAYIFRDEAGTPIYVGKAGDLRDRLVQHARGDNPAGWAAVMHERARGVDWIVTRSETEALILEANLIKAHKPIYNIRLADDKSYPYLKLTDEPFPRLLVVRDLPDDARVRVPGGRGKVRRRLHDPKRHEVHKLGHGEVFGPYPTAAVMWKMRDIASQVFGLRHCRKALDPSRPLRPCLNYHIKRCVGPCRGEMTPEEYRQVVEQVEMLLEGRTEEVRAQFEARMKQAAAELDFERAATYRDKIKALESASQDQLVNAAEERDQDVLAVALEDDFAVVEMFPVRSGRLLAPEHFSFSHVRGRLTAEVLEAAMTVHYSQHVIPPRTILLPEPLPNTAEWETMLAELREGKVELAVPQRGEKRKLVALAEKNARVNLIQLQEERGRKRAENLAALNDLAEVLQMPGRPARIECYDISNLQGQEAVGSMVVFTDGLPDKRHYRRFKIWLEGGPDDYAMMAEMVQRRLQRGLAGDPKFLPLPDLLLVDGGKGQVSTIERVLEREGLNGQAAPGHPAQEPADDGSGPDAGDTAADMRPLRAVAGHPAQEPADDGSGPDAGDTAADMRPLRVTLAGLAKREEEVFVPGQSEPLNMEEHPRGRFLLQRVRDEAHRFAHSYHEGLRSSNLTRSQLDLVPGIGPTRRAALFRAFPSLQAMSEASVDELAAVEGMNRTAAQKLHEFFLDAAHEATPLRGEEG